MHCGTLLRRILEGFRPQIHDIENIIADPETAQAKRLAMTHEANMGDLMRLIPQLSQLAHDVGSGNDNMALAQQKQIFEQDKAMKELQLQEKELELQARQQQADAGSQGVATVPQNTQAISPQSSSLATDASTNLTR